MNYLIRQGKYSDRRQGICRLATWGLLLLFCCTILIQKNPQSVFAAENTILSLPRDIQITNPVTETEYTENVHTNPTIIHNGYAMPRGHFPMVQTNSVWMADAQGFLVELMDYGFQVTDIVTAADDENNAGNKKKNQSVQFVRSFTVRNPRMDTTIVFTVGQKTATVNNNTKTLPNPVVLGTDMETEETVLLLPIVWTLQQSGYTVSETGDQITVTDSTLYYKTNYDATYDTAVYTNCLEGLYVTKNSNNVAHLFRLNMVKNMPSSQVTISDQQEETAVTVTLKKTKNSLGNITKSFSGDILKKLQVKETSSHDTTIKLWYGVKYIYTKQYYTKGLTVKFSKTSYSMRVLVPDKVNMKKITTTDQYWKNKFLIVIPGNHVNYYKKNKPIKNSSGIKSINVTKTAENNTKITVSTKKLYGYRIMYSKCGYFTVKIGSLKSMYQNIVMLDAGHGGKDHGAKKNGAREKSLNLNILYTRAKKYFDAQNSTVKAFWTRHNDTFINLYARPKYSKKYSADLFVSLHMNSAPSRAARGTEVYFARQNNKRNKAGLTSKIVAKRLLSTLTTDLNMKNRGVHHAGFVVIKHNTVPSVLVELGFVSNKSDSRKLKKASFQKKAAKSLYEGIADIFEDYPTGR